MIKRPGTLGLCKTHGSSICCDIQSWLARDRITSPRMAGFAPGGSSAANNEGRNGAVVAITIKKVVLNRIRHVRSVLVMIDSWVRLPHFAQTSKTSSQFSVQFRRVKNGSSCSTQPTARRFSRFSIPRHGDSEIAISDIKSLESRHGGSIGGRNPRQPTQHVGEGRLPVACPAYSLRKLTAHVGPTLTLHVTTPPKTMQPSRPLPIDTASIHYVSSALRAAETFPSAESSVRFGPCC